MTTLKGPLAGPPLGGASSLNRAQNTAQDAAYNEAQKSAQSEATAKPGAELLSQLTEAIAPGRGNSHWLSAKEASALLEGAAKAGPEASSSLKAKLTEGLTQGNIDGQPLTLGARALKTVAAFCEVDPQVYLQAAPELARITGASTRMGATFEAARAESLPGAERLSPAAQMAQTVATGLAEVAEAVKTPSGPADLSTLDGVRSFADQQLDAHLGDRGLKREGLDVELRFDRSQWKPKNFENQRGLEDAIDGAASFLAQMAEDRGGEVSLAVQLTPKGKLERTTGTDRDTLWVPVNKGVDALALRKDWDDGAFIRADNVFNPLDHLKAGKLRTLWKLVGNPVGVVRTRMRRVLGDAQSDLVKSLGNLLQQSATLPPEQLREKASEVVRAFMGPDVAARQGEGAGASASLRDTLLARVADVDEHQLVSFLTRWKDVASDVGLVEEVNEFAVGATANRLKDSQVKIGLVNVDTYDAISVAPDSALSRHGQMAVNEVELDGVRVGLVNVQSVDMVSVVPDLARMIFGGTAMERAADESGLLP